MIDHTTLCVADAVASRAFYEKALACIGYEMLFEVPTEHTNGTIVYGFGVAPKSQLWIAGVKPNDPRIHIAFQATHRKQVDDFYKAALEAGGKDNGAPGPRPHYHENYYGAFVLDPDGHNIEVVCHVKK